MSKTAKKATIIFQAALVALLAACVGYAAGNIQAWNSVEERYVSKWKANEAIEYISNERDRYKEKADSASEAALRQYYTAQELKAKLEELGEDPGYVPVIHLVPSGN